MARFELRIWINASPQICFDAARDIGLHCRTAHWTQERAVGGVTSGPIELGQSVTFEGVHLGLRQQLTSRIVAMEAPHSFVDEMQNGAFAQMRHLHQFTALDGGTVMSDIVTWRSPLGILGIWADKWFVCAHLKRFVL